MNESLEQRLAQIEATQTEILGALRTCIARQERGLTAAQQVSIREQAQEIHVHGWPKLKRGRK